MLTRETNAVPGESYDIPEHRRPCQWCGDTSKHGYIKRSGLQRPVICGNPECHRARYNAPKDETGERPVSLSTVHKAITTRLRERIIERATGRCELCGSRKLLTVGHLLSVKDGLDAGLESSFINSDENLSAMCAECNSGLSESTVPLRLVIAIQKARQALWASHG